MLSRVKNGVENWTKSGRKGPKLSEFPIAKVAKKGDYLINSWGSKEKVPQMITPIKRRQFCAC